MQNKLRLHLQTTDNKKSKPLTQNNQKNENEPRRPQKRIKIQSDSNPLTTQDQSQC